MFKDLTELLTFIKDFSTVLSGIENDGTLAALKAALAAIETELQNPAVEAIIADIEGLFAKGTGA